ncbi:MAG: hypothetical protein ACK42L_04140 [Thermoanaerobaculum sp.]
MKLCKLDLGDEVVIAKINQAKEVNFQLDTDSLVKLKEQGVSKAVIEAMLKRATQVREQPPSAVPGSAGAGTAGGAAANADEFVMLRTKDGEFRLQSVLGSESVTYAVVTMLTFLDFPGVKAEVRTTDRRPTLVVRSAKNPKGRVFLVKCEPDNDDNVRSVKLGKAGMFSQKSWSSPDSDWTVAYDYKELGNNVWEIVPKVELKPGEYGLLFRGGLAGVLGGTEGELFDFGVD